MAVTRQAGRGQGSAPVLDIYARISRSTDSTRGRSVAAQVEDGIADITARGAQVGQVFRDESRSAWDPRTDRPEFNALMTRLESGDADGVWVWELTRFSRKVLDGERLLAAAESGALVWSDDQEHNLTKAAGRRSFREAMVAAAAESDTISERTRRGKMRKALRGRSNASQRGFASAGLLPNPPGWEPGDPRFEVSDVQLAAEREAVREVARRMLAGETWASILTYLNASGIRTVAGNAWSLSALRTMMRRPSLAGILIHDGAEVGVMPGEHALDRQTWERVQAHLASRTRGRKPSEQYLLTSVLVCDRCDRRMVGRPRVSRSPYKNDDGTESVAREYWCQKRVGEWEDNGCGRLSVDQRFADGVVEDALLLRLGDPHHADRVARQAALIGKQRDRLNSEVSRLSDDADALAGKVAAWGAARVDKAMGPILARLATLQAALDALEMPDTVPEAAQDARQLWRDLEGNTAARRALIRRTYPDGIRVRPATALGGARLDEGRFDFGATP